MNFKNRFMVRAGLTALLDETYNKIRFVIQNTVYLEGKNHAGIFYKACNG